MTQPADITHTPYSLPDVTTWHDRFLQWLERIYTSPKLYQWSMSNPLTRWIPRRRTQKLFDLMSGFVYSQVLLGCVRLDLFKMLQQAPLISTTEAKAPSWRQLLSQAKEGRV